MRFAFSLRPTFANEIFVLDYKKTSNILRGNALPMAEGGIDDGEGDVQTAPD